jgi:hypothetical protein
MLLPQEWAGYSFSVGEFGFFETAYLDPRGRQYPDRSYFFLPLLPLPDELRRARIYAFPKVEKNPERIPEKITILCFGDEVKYSGDDFYTEQNTIFRETMIAYGTFPKLPAKLYSLAVRDTLPDQTARSFLLRPEYIMDNPPPALVAVTDVEIQGLHDSPQTFCGMSEESSLPPQIAVQPLCKLDSAGKCTAP